jgi:carbamoyl-phosphate synthase large subunit
LRKAGVNDVSVLHKVREVDKNPNIVDYLQTGKIDLVINIPMPNNAGKYADILKDEYTIRRLAIEFNIPVVTNLELASALMKILEGRDSNRLSTRSLNEYMDSLAWKFW